MSKSIQKMEKRIFHKNRKTIAAEITAVLLIMLLLTGGVFCAVPVMADENDPEGSPGEEQTAEPVSVLLEDGEYSIEVNMTGGGGRASVSSPTLLAVREKKAYARLIWSSTDCDYIALGDVRYENEADAGGSAEFMIPVTAFDEPVRITAGSSEGEAPEGTDYTLMFYEKSIGPKGRIPQEAAKNVLIIAAVIIVGGWFLDYFVKKRRRR